MGIEKIIAGVLVREGGGKFTDNPDDAGGPTRYGITEKVARANGYTGDMRDMPAEVAWRIYEQRYIADPGFDKVIAMDRDLAEELIDTGVNMGPAVATKFLQRALNALNLAGALFGNLAVDGVLGAGTLTALDTFIRHRGREGRAVLLRAVNCLQGARYVELCEGREQNETFFYGWILQRVKIGHGDAEAQR